jgi:hypothetical protein
MIQWKPPPTHREFDLDQGARPVVCGGTVIGILGRIELLDAVARALCEQDGSGRLDFAVPQDHH